MLNNCPYMVHF